MSEKSVGQRIRSIFTMAYSSRGHRGFWLERSQVLCRRLKGSLQTVSEFRVNNESTAALKSRLTSTTEARARQATYSSVAHPSPLITPFLLTLIQSSGLATEKAVTSATFDCDVHHTRARSRPALVIPCTAASVSPSEQKPAAGLSDN